MSLLSVDNLKVHYKTDQGDVQAVDDVSFTIDQGEIAGLIGESGCGKSTLANALIHALPDSAQIVDGKITLDGRDMISIEESELRNIRWNTVAVIPQNAMACLDPIYSIEDQILEILDMDDGLSKEQAVERMKEVLDVVGIQHSRLNSYPHQLSGGMKQRLILAMAILLEPKLIIADEPTTGLDVLIRDRILSDIEKLKEKFNISIIFISHDIADVIETSDSVMIMYGGKIVEQGPSKDVLSSPQHPYTMSLKRSLPQVVSDPEDLLEIDMDPPDLVSPPKGCRFIKKCPFVKENCKNKHPPLERVNPNRKVACIRHPEADLLRKQVQEVSWT